MASPTLHHGPGRAKKISDETQQLINSWLSVDWDAESREHVKGLVAAGKEEELVAHLGHRISFGTAGLRGKMKWGFAFMNAVTVTQASQGLCAYLRTVYPCLPTLRQMGVVVGHDGRYNSRLFARLTAAVFLSRKIKVYLFRDDVPTPLVAFGVRHLKCAAGVMVTASHNPKEDNGYKVYWANSAQITAPHDAQIERAIEANFSIWDLPEDKAIDEHALCLDPAADVCAAYLTAVRQWSFRSAEQNAAAQLKVVYTAMHGVGGQSVERAFEAFGLPPIIPVREQHSPDPDFTTIEFPNPEEANGCGLRLAMAVADREGAPLILANDPDADRLAVAERRRDGSWRILDGNEIALLLADWLWRNYTERHPEVDRARIVMLNSTVSSKVLAAMAQHEGFHHRETLCGFKWLGNQADELARAGYTFLFAYEVEIGFMIGDMSLDTDGVRAAPVFVEMANHVYEQGRTLSDQLDLLYHKYGYYKMATGYFYCPDPKLMHQIFSEIRNDGLYISTCGDHKVQSVRDLTTGFDSSKPHPHRTSLPVPASNTGAPLLQQQQQMITFTFENGCVATFRGSGTEPNKLKYYIEVASASNEQLAADLLDSMKQEIIDRFLQPSQNGLRPPATDDAINGNGVPGSPNECAMLAPARVARDVVRKEIQALENLEAMIGRDFERVVEIIENRGAGRVIFTGVGKSGIIAQKISASFSSLGISSFFVHATEAAHGDLGVITAEDVVVCISNSGNTPELIFIIPSLRVLAGKIVGITSNKDSLLARYSDAAIITGKIPEADQHKIAPTASTIVCLAIGDALAVTLSSRMKFTLPEFGLRHPGGVLGERVLGKVFQEFAMKGQGRFLRFWKSMTNEERDKLKRDFERIDLAELSKIYLKCRSRGDAAIDVNSLEPLPAQACVTLESSVPTEVEAWRDAGLRAVHEGKVAVVLLAGGQASRLGLTMPKGFLDLNLPSHKSLFQLHAEKLLRLQDDVRQRLGGGAADADARTPEIPLYVMTSPEALQQTHQFFIKHRFFGLAHKQVFFFKQRSLPCVSPSGEIIMDTKCSVVFSSDGHGGLFVALKDAKAYEDMKRRGVEYVFAFGVDNPLSRVADPVFMGHCIQRNVKVGCKVVHRREPQEAVGVVCVRDGAISCVEHAELPEAVAELRDERSGDGLAYDAANILNLFFTLRFMRKMADNPSLMEYHLTKKRIPFVNDNGVRTEPLVPNGWKFEKRVLDCLPYANNSVAVMFVRREDEFAPIRNGWNSEVDSPRSARRLLAAHYKRRIERAGGKVAPDVVHDPDKLVEVSSLVSDEALALLVKDRELVTGPAILQ